MTSSRGVFDAGVLRRRLAVVPVLVVPGRRRRPLGRGGVGGGPGGGVLRGFQFPPAVAVGIMLLPSLAVAGDLFEFGVEPAVQETPPVGMEHDGGGRGVTPREENLTWKYEK